MNEITEGQFFEMMRESDQLKRPHPPIEFLERIFADSLKQNIDDEKEFDDFLQDSTEPDENEEEIQRFRNQRELKNIGDS